jgi:hypothetical protein
MPLFPLLLSACPHHKPPLTIQTVGAAFGAKVVQVEGKTVTLGIWDTAGAER